MSILEMLFSRTLVKLKENMTKLDDILFEPVKSKHQYLEHVPVSMTYELCKFKHIYIGKLKVVWEEYELPYCKGKYKPRETKIEVRSVYKNKCSVVAIANKLYRKAVKIFIRDIKPKGFKSCLLEHYSIEEGELYEYSFYLNRTEYILSTFTSKKKKK